MCVKERGLIELGGVYFLGICMVGKNLALSCKIR